MSRLAINYTEYHKKVFESTISYYVEAKRTHGHTPSRDYETVITNGPPDGNRNTKLVRPGISDFICDVELAAKRALSNTLFAQFQAVYIDQITSVDELSREDVATITEQVGKMLIHRQIYPINGYLRGKDLR